MLLYSIRAMHCINLVPYGMRVSVILLGQAGPSRPPKSENDTKRPLRLELRENKT